MGHRLDKLYVETITADVSQENVWQELVDLQSSINKLMKKFSIGTKLKIWKEEKGATKKIRDILRQALASGKTDTQQIEQEIRDEVVKWKDNEPNFKDYEVERVARTEAKAMSIMNKLLRWKEYGFEKVQWRTYVTPESGKYDVSMNNKIIDINEALSNPELRPPAHPNCRCTMVLFE